MANTHFSGPLVIGGTQLTGNSTLAKLAQTVSATPSQTEVQLISTKVDAIIQELIDAGIIRAT